MLSRLDQFDAVTASCSLRCIIGALTEKDNSLFVTPQDRQKGGRKISVRLSYFI